MTIFRSLAAALIAALLSAPALAQTIGPPTIVSGAYRYTNITTTSTTTIKSSSGILHAICINNPTATETITIYDNTAASGTKIATITLAATTQGCFFYDAVTTTGLTIVTAVAASDITVLWQ